MRININEIKINPGRREAALGDIQELARSISEVGLLNPITITQDKTLIAGLHRLEAAEMLGWTEIECTVLDLDELKAELAEIDENFVRTALSGAEQGKLLSRRKQIYETLHPEKRHGGDRKSEKIKATNCRDDRVKSFAEDTAEKLGISPRTVERRVWVAEHLTPEATQILRSSDARITHQALEKIAHLAPEKQPEAVKHLLSQEPSRKRRAAVADDIAQLKDTNKVCSCSPESFLEVFSGLVKEMQGRFSVYHLDFYEQVYPKLKPEHLSELQRLANSAQAAFDEFVRYVCEKNSNPCESHEQNSD